MLLLTDAGAERRTIASRRAPAPRPGRAPRNGARRAPSRQCTRRGGRDCGATGPLTGRARRSGSPRSARSSSRCRWPAPRAAPGREAPARPRRAKTQRSVGPRQRRRMRRGTPRARSTQLLNRRRGLPPIGAEEAGHESGLAELDEGQARHGLTADVHEEGVSVWISVDVVARRRREHGAAWRWRSSFTQASPCAKRARSSGVQLAGVVSFEKGGQRGSGTCGEPGTKYDRYSPGLPRSSAALA